VGGGPIPLTYLWRGMEANCPTAIFGDTKKTIKGSQRDKTGVSLGGERPKIDRCCHDYFGRRGGGEERRSEEHEH